MSQQRPVDRRALERVIAETLAASNGTLWDLTPLEDIEASEDAAGDVYHRDARAVLVRLEELGVIGSE